MKAEYTKAISGENLLKVIQSALIILWIYLLRKTNAYHIVYLYCGILGCLAALVKCAPMSAGQKRAVWLVSGGLSLAIGLANGGCIDTALGWTLVLSGGFVVWERLFFAAYALMRNHALKCDLPRRHPKRVFLVSFVGFACVYLLHLFGVGYPGNMTVDSISQIGQVFSGKYSNHHPYWHTKIIGLLVHIGLAVFGDVNAGVAVYSAVQSLLMALCFAFAVMTLYQMGIGRRWIVLVQLWYMSMPYHIMYSITMWKDVLFGCAVLLLVIALWRLMSETGTVWINHVLLWMGALGMALLRNNGFLALAATLAVYLIAFGMSRRGIALTMAAALCVAWVMNNPVLDRLGVAEIGIEHSLSIPIQQMARVVAYDGTITQEQMERLDRITDVQQIEHIYLSYISDPMKDSMNGAYIRENKLEFIRLWLEIGLQNPMTYLQAWIEQTKGYWDSGYEYWIWHTGVQDNGYGIASGVPQKALGALSKWYFNSLFDMAWLRPLISIGLHVWIILALGILHLLCGDRRRAFLSIPVLMIIGTLLVATPVFSEFRYAYAVFTVLPAYLMISLPLERCKN